MCDPFEIGCYVITLDGKDEFVLKLFLDGEEGLFPRVHFFVIELIGHSEIAQCISEVFTKKITAVVAFDFAAPNKGVFFLVKGRGVSDGAKVANAIKAE